MSKLSTAQTAVLKRMADGDSLVWVDGRGYLYRNGEHVRAGTVYALEARGLIACPDEMGGFYTVTDSGRDAVTTGGVGQVGTVDG